MRRLIALGLVLFCGLGLYAQKDGLAKLSPVELFDTARYQVKYLHVHSASDDSAERIGLQVLLVGSKYSLWESYAHYVSDSIAYESRDKGISSSEYKAKSRVEMQGDNLRLLRNHSAADSTRGQEFFLTFEPTINVSQPCFSAADPHIEWVVEDEHKTIHNVEVTKATGRVYGRDWTVWFAESIPFFEGPWELKDAPGLILEAYDATGEHQFTLEEAIPVEKIIVYPVPQSKVLTREEFRKYRAAHFAAEIVKKKRGGMASDTFDNFLDLE